VGSDKKRFPPTYTLMKTIRL